eukprot:269636-Pyramimonas_sp.AAC.1
MSSGEPVEPLSDIKSETTCWGGLEYLWELPTLLDRGSATRRRRRRRRWVGRAGWAGHSSGGSTTVE